MSQPDPAAQAARRLQQEENRAILQATVHAQRALKQPRHKPSSGSEAVTAVVVLVSVVALLFLAFRYGN